MAHKVKSHLETEGYLTTKSRLFIEDGLYDNNSSPGTNGQVLSKDASGNVVWADSGGGGIDGSGTAGAITKWTDNDTVDNSDFMTETPAGRHRQLAGG